MEVPLSGYIIGSLASILPVVCAGRTIIGAIGFDRSISPLRFRDGEAALQEYMTARRLDRTVIIVSNLVDGDAWGTFWSLNGSFIQLSSHQLGADPAAATWTAFHEFAHIQKSHVVKGGACCVAALTPSIPACCLFPMSCAAISLFSLGLLGGLAYLRAEESEADRLACEGASVEILQGGIRLLEAWRRVHREEREGSYSCKRILYDEQGNSRFAFCSTHPSEDDRLHVVVEELRRRGVTVINLDLSRSSCCSYCQSTNEPEEGQPLIPAADPYDLAVDIDQIQTLMGATRAMDEVANRSCCSRFMCGFPFFC